MIDLNKIFQSKFVSGLICGLAIFIVLSLTFAAGLAVGFKKADFSYRFGDNYRANFAGPDPSRDMMRRADGGEYIDGHGVIGQIIKANGGSLVIKDRDNIEKIVLATDKTQINRFRESIKLSDLKADDSVIVIGEPNSKGEIEAKLIRVMPQKPIDGQAPGESAGAPASTTNEIK